MEKALEWAIRCGDAPHARAILSSGARVPQHRLDGMLVTAIQNSQVAIAQLLLRHGASACGALPCAVSQKDAAMAKMLIEHAVKGKKQLKGVSTSFIDDLVRWGHEEILNLVLKNSSPRDLEDIVRDAINFGNYSVAAYLIGKRVAHSPSDAHRAAQLAIYYRRIDLVRIILNNSKKEKYIQQLITIAVMRGGEMVELLLSYGVQVNNEDTICAAVRYAPTSVLERLAPLFDRDKMFGFIRLAAYDGKISSVEFLLDAGAPEPERQAAIYCAIVGRHIRLVRLLLDRGVDPNARFEGQPLIYYASKRGLIDIVNLLIERGAEPPEQGVIRVRRTTAECCVMREPFAPGAHYRVCRSNAPHAFDAAFSKGIYENVCVACRQPLDPNVYVNE